MIIIPRYNARVRLEFCSKLLFGSVIAIVAACLAPRSRDPYQMTSAELERAGERDTVFVRRIRTLEQIAARMPVDSLARLYTGALAAPADSGGAYKKAIQCQIDRMMRANGPAATLMAMRRVEDSLFTTKAARRDWSLAQSRFPSALPRDYHCDRSDLPPLPDSLKVWPQRNH